MVFYRKYRSQKIDELDNAIIRKNLFSVLKKDIPHAFLFTGPKGLGKTSTARIIAKVVNCTTPPSEREGELEPCNQCDQCISITKGNNIDILEIDAASNRGIDEIRDLKEKIRLSPVSSSKKVYIIDEVHMLTTEAFNALLKTLEEPPEHAMFILCTTEPQKIPSTILSRCFHLTFRLATEDELVRAFGRIVVGEGITVDKEALQLIASLAEGGFRDGVKILEEVVSLSDGEPITKEKVEEKYQVSSMKSQGEALLASLVKKDTKAGITIIASLVDQGADLKHFLQTLMNELHEQLLVHVGSKKHDSQTKQQLKIEEIQALFILLSKAANEMKYAVLPQLPLELAIIEYCQKEEKSPQPPLPKGGVTRTPLEKGSPDRAGDLNASAQDVTVSSLRKQVGAIKKNQALYGEPKKDVVDDEPKIAISKVELMHVPVEGVTKEWLDSLWMHIIGEMKQYNHTIAGVLRGCSIKSYDKKNLIIQANYKFHKERLDENKTREALIKVCKLLTGNEVSVAVELKSS